MHDSASPAGDEFYIGSRRIRVVLQDRYGRPAQKATRRFSGGTAGATDAGVYSFWTVLAGHVPLFVFRTREHGSIEDALSNPSRMSVRQREALETRADRVLPATGEEINQWLRTNPDEAFHVVSS